MVSRSDAEAEAQKRFPHGMYADPVAWAKVVDNTYRMLCKDAGSDVIAATPEELVEAIGGQRFKIPSARYPEREIWWQVDYIDDEGKVVLKMAENQK